MRVAYVTPFDPDDVRQAWSGTGYFMPRALEAQDGVEVLRVGPLRESWKRVFQARQAFHRYLNGGRTHLRDLEPTTQRSWARQTASVLGPTPPDVLLSIDPRFVRGLDRLGVLTDVPLVLWGDATFASLVGFYERYSHLSASSLQRGHALWQWTVQRASHLVFSSEWAARSAIADYDADPGRVHVVPFGTNLAAPPSRAEVEAAIATRPMDTCRLLFLSVDWPRKGGPLAFEIAKTLNERGLPTTLTVVGCTPEVDGPLPSWVEPLGYISKHAPDGLARLGAILGRSHFLVLPSEADCTPMVFAEAGAYGLPALSREVGGIPSVVREGVGGFLFDPQAGPEPYADTVQRLLGDPAMYTTLALRARTEHETRLDWATSGAAVADILRQAVREGARP